MPQFIVFRVPDKVFEGYDPFYELIELEPNNLQFAIVKAKTMELAREKWFYELYYPKIKEYCISDAARRLKDIFDDHDKDDLIRLYGDHDGKIIWELASDADEEEITEADAVKAAKRLSQETIDRLVFDIYEMDIGVTEICAVIE